MEIKRREQIEIWVHDMTIGAGEDLHFTVVAESVANRLGRQLLAEEYLVVKMKYVECMMMMENP